MGRKKEICRIDNLLEKKYALCVRLRDCMLSLYRSIENGETSEMGMIIGKRDSYMKRINKVDKQITENREFLSALFQNKESGDGFLIKTRINKTREILEEIADIQKKCLICGKSQVVQLKQEILSVRQQIHAFKSYIPHSPSHSRFVDTVR
ncbi:MAG: hypothetical protein SVY10_10695 [Thermodesulfobacteriota bacterium]|nr:hypothetical protein [Thermodesulfobacteriota bacterium]